MFRISSSKNESNDRPYADLVVADYYPIDCAAAQKRFDAISDGESIISAGFQGKRNQPNIVYTSSTRSSRTYTSGIAPELYTAKNIHLYGHIHDISGLNHDGEIVVEHEWGNRKLFVCFPVKRGTPRIGGTYGDPVETIVSSADPATTRANGSFTELRLNDAVGSRAISYMSIDQRGMPCRVVIFLDVIQTAVDISGYSHSARDLFVAEPKMTPIVLSIRLQRETEVHSENNVGDRRSLSSAPDLSSVEGFSTTKDANGKDILVSDGPANDVLTCEYLPVDSETAQVFQIPIDTNIIADTAHQEMTSIALYFMMSILFGVFIFFMAPIIYWCDVANYFRQRLPESLDFLNGWFMTSELSWTDVILVSVMSFLAIVLTSAGISSGNNPLKAGGLVILVMLFVGGFGIYASVKMGWRDANTHLAKSTLV